MPEVLLSLGSNIQPQQHLNQAMQALRELPGLSAVRESTRYKAPAVGFDGPDFVNSAVYAQWQGELGTLQVALQTIEDAAKRDRSAPRFSSRTLDIDIVLFGDLISSAGSGLPRAELLQCAFVLRPCAEMAPNWLHPQTGQTLAAHWAQWQAAKPDPLLPL